MSKVLVIGAGGVGSVAVHKMAVGDFRHIPIVDESGSPVGVVAAADVFRHIANALG